MNSQYKMKTQTIARIHKTKVMYTLRYNVYKQGIKVLNAGMLYIHFIQGQAIFAQDAKIQEPFPFPSCGQVDINTKQMIPKLRNRGYQTRRQAWGRRQKSIARFVTAIVRPLL